MTGPAINNNTSGLTNASDLLCANCSNYYLDDHTNPRLYNGIVVLLLMMLNMVGNSVVFYVYYTKNTVFSLYVRVLAALDLLTALTTMLIDVIMKMKPHDQTDFNLSVMCKLSHFQVYANSLTSGCVLTLIAYQRYRKICHPLKRTITLCHARIMLLVIGLTAMAISVPSIIVYGPIEITVLVGDALVPTTICRHPDEHKGTVLQLATSYSLLLAFSLVLITTIVLYAMVARAIRKFERRNPGQRPASTLASPTSPAIIIVKPNDNVFTTPAAKAGTGASKKLKKPRDNGGDNNAAAAGMSKKNHNDNHNNDDVDVVAAEDDRKAAKATSRGAGNKKKTTTTTKQKQDNRLDYDYDKYDTEANAAALEIAIINAQKNATMIPPVAAAAATNGGGMVNGHPMTSPVHGRTGRHHQVNAQVADQEQNGEQTADKARSKSHDGRKRERDHGHDDGGHNKAHDNGRDKGHGHGHDKGQGHDKPHDERRKDSKRDNPNAKSHKNHNDKHTTNNHHKNHNHNNTAPTSPTAANSNNSNTQKHHHNRLSHARASIFSLVTSNQVSAQMYRVFAVITVVFIVSYLPHLVVLILTKALDLDHKTLTHPQLALLELAYNCPYIATVSNPLVYGFSSSEFRDRLYEVFYCDVDCCRRPRPRQQQQPIRR